MARFRCNSCGGVYRDALPDGTLYFHACPPEWDDTRKVWRARRDKRDENFDRRGWPERRRARSEGRGRTEIAEDLSA